MLITENIVRLIENEIISQMKKNEYININQLMCETGLSRDNIDNALIFMQKNPNTAYKIAYVGSSSIQSKKVIIKS